MKKFFLTCLLLGLAHPASAKQSIPAFLAGEWASSDFVTAKDDNSEPEGGRAIYLLEDGHAMVWCVVAGVACQATYQEKTGVLRLKTVRTEPGPFEAIVARYHYDPQAKTLNLLQSKPPESAEMLKLETYRRRRAKVPEFFLRGLRQL